MENSAGISFMGFTRMDLESAVCFLCAVVFSLFLMVFSWQDLHRKRIRVSWLYGFGTAGMALTMIRCVLSVIKDGWDWKKSALQITVWLLGMLPGIFLFWMERQTKGAVGLGDGCFFLITGCYLGGWRTLELLMGAVFVSSLAETSRFIQEMLSASKSTPEAHTAEMAASFSAFSPIDHSPFRQAVP